MIRRKSLEADILLSVVCHALKSCQQITMSLMWDEENEFMGSLSFSELIVFLSERMEEKLDLSQGGRVVVDISK